MLIIKQDRSSYLYTASKTSNNNNINNNNENVISNNENNNNTGFMSRMMYTTNMTPSQSTI